MDVFGCLLPRNLIYAIPYFKCQGSNIPEIGKEFLQEQLLLSEENHDLVKLARGEGRKSILDSIIDKPDIIFDWGEKSIHAFLENSKVRDFLEPNVVNKEMLLSFVNLYKEELAKHCNRYFKKRNPYVNSDEVIDKIRKAIKSIDSYNELIIIKDWLCYALHTAGNKDFRAISPWVSTSMGDKRYKTAYLYGSGNYSIFKPNNKNYSFNKRFVVLDYWVPVNEEGLTYRNADYVGNKLRNMGIPWHFNRHNEVMVKYGLLPHQLIGYYYFENDQLKYYFINHHYLDEWKENSNFKIGDNVYIDQTNVDFPSNNPYRVIYLKHGRSFSIFGRR
ncbi:MULTISPECIES: hypothetical protein [Clostridium]|uniref:DUF4238 domain-containing protein n=1 Tax=Clostridium lapidicellarium TaxID=3240931 RepID=A0ABV4DUY6_9CLOT